MSHRRHHYPHFGVLWRDKPLHQQGGPPNARPCHGHDHPGANAGQPLPGYDKQREHEHRIPSCHPPLRRPSHPEIAARQAGGPTHHRPNATQRGIAGPAAALRQRGRHSRCHQAEKPPRHRHRHKRRDHRIEDEAHRTDEVKSGRHHRCRHRPDGGACDHRLKHLPTDPSKPLFQRGSTAFDEPFDGIVGIGAGQGGRGSDQHGCRQKRELRADPKQFRRMPEEHEDRRQRQRISRQRPPSDRCSQTGQPDQQRCPHDGRLRPHERHVEPCATGHRHERPAAG